MGHKEFHGKTPIPQSLLKPKSPEVAYGSFVQAAMLQLAHGFLIEAVKIGGHDVSLKLSYEVKDGWVKGRATLIQPGKEK